MQRLRRILALALVALWLPATLHCDLEAAGLEIGVLCHDHDTPEAAAAHCTDDACHAIEDAAYTAVTLTKLVSGTVLSVVALLPEPLELPAAALSPASTDVPLEVPRSWRFSTRAAPPARAPSVAV